MQHSVVTYPSTCSLFIAFLSNTHLSGGFERREVVSGAPVLRCHLLAGCVREKTESSLHTLHTLQLFVLPPRETKPPCDTIFQKFNQEHIWNFLRQRSPHTTCTGRKCVNKCEQMNRMSNNRGKRCQWKERWRVIRVQIAVGRFLSLHCNYGDQKLFLISSFNPRVTSDGRFVSLGRGLSTLLSPVIL